MSDLPRVSFDYGEHVRTKVSDVATAILNLEESVYREALISLGWTPPFGAEGGPARNGWRPYEER